MPGRAGGSTAPASAGPEERKPLPSPARSAPPLPSPRRRRPPPMSQGFPGRPRPERLGASPGLHGEGGGGSGSAGRWRRRQQQQQPQQQPPHVGRLVALVVDQSWAPGPAGGGWGAAGGQRQQPQLGGGQPGGERPQAGAGAGGGAQQVHQPPAGLAEQVTPAARGDTSPYLFLLLLRFLPRLHLPLPRRQLLIPPTPGSSSPQRSGDTPSWVGGLGLGLGLLGGVWAVSRKGVRGLGKQRACQAPVFSSSLVFPSVSKGVSGCVHLVPSFFRAGKLGLSSGIAAWRSCCWGRP